MIKPEITFLLVGRILQTRNNLEDFIVNSKFNVDFKAIILAVRDEYVLNYALAVLYIKK
jgi:hypothetical protein